MALTPCTYRRVFRVIATLVLLGLPAWAYWPPISPEDLKMADLPEQKGAPAVILLREEVADDLNNYHSVYERIKILTQGPDAATRTWSFLIGGGPSRLTA